MAFSSTIENVDEIPGVFGRKRLVFGRWLNPAGTDVGGPIDTGLTRIDFLTLQQTATSTITSEPTIDATFPIESGTVNISTAANVYGIWMAIGDAQ